MKQKITPLLNEINQELIDFDYEIIIIDDVRHNSIKKK